MKIIALFSFMTSLSFSQISDMNTHGIWILRESILTPTSVDSALTYAAESGFNKVFIQVRSRGDALYTSDIVVNHPRIEPSFDPLSYAIELGHEMKLEIHAWMNMYVLWSSKIKPVNTEHIYYTRHEWTEANHHGKMDWRIDISRPPSPNWEGIFLSPIHPQVNYYLRSVVKEVITEYNVDGIHLDYIRYQDDFYGFNPLGRELFKEIYEVDPLDIERGIISTRFGWEQSFADSMVKTWESFKRNKVTELVQFIRTDMMESGKNMMLSVAVKSNLDIAQNRYFQDWPSWLKMNLVDFIIPMNYHVKISNFTQDIGLIKATVLPENIDRIVMGISTYNQNVESVIDKILTTYGNGFSGICIYSYDSHKNNLDWFYPILNTIQKPVRN